MPAPAPTTWWPSSSPISWAASFFLAAGFLLGGTVGAGTLVAALLTGPVVQFWLPRTAPVTRWIDGPGD